MEEKSKKILESAERIKCLEIEINDVQSQLNLKEGERISYIEKCSEKVRVSQVQTFINLFYISEQNNL